jgi:inhibitor of KinA sporulation pathway (predicted exonuclease)
MNYIVFDLEWNIAGRANKVDPEDAKAMPFEIIEIGAVKLDDTFEVISRFSVTIRPRLYPILSGHVAAVTKRMQQSLRYGLLFPDAARDFLQWCGSDYLFCTWSESDTSVLKQNLAFYGIPDRLEAKCLDVQYLFDQVVEQADVQRSIEYAVDFLRLNKSKPFHQAVQDAWYTGRILQSIAQQAVSETDSDSLSFDVVDYAYDPNLNRSYQQTLEPQPSAEAVLHTLRKQKLTCPACGAELARINDWQKQGSKVVADFICPVHGSVTGKTRFRSKTSERVIAYLTMRLDRYRPLPEG